MFRLVGYKVSNTDFDFILEIEVEGYEDDHQKKDTTGNADGILIILSVYKDNRSSFYTVLTCKAFM